MSAACRTSLGKGGAQFNQRFNGWFAGLTKSLRTGTHSSATGSSSHIQRAKLLRGLGQRRGLFGRRESRCSLRILKPVKKTSAPK